MGDLIIPKFYTEISSPLIFLAGPIKGAPSWQDDAAEFLLSRNPNISVASPRKTVGENLKKYLVDGRNDYFPRQRAWERFYLGKASKNGVILFWLPGEKEHNCKKSYGAMTRYELAQWSTRAVFDKGIKICVGSDGNFSEMDTIKYDLSVDLPDLKIENSLEETCSEALRLIKS